MHTHKLIQFLSRWMMLTDCWPFLHFSSCIIGGGRSERRPNGIYRGQGSLEESSECAKRDPFRSNTGIDSQVFHRFVVAWNDTMPKIESDSAKRESRLRYRDIPGVLEILLDCPGWNHCCLPWWLRPVLALELVGGSCRLAEFEAWFFMLRPYFVYDSNVPQNDQYG